MSSRFFVFDTLPYFVFDTLPYFVFDTLRLMTYKIDIQPPYNSINFSDSERCLPIKIKKKSVASDLDPNGGKNVQCSL